MVSHSTSTLALISAQSAYVNNYEMLIVVKMFPKNSSQLIRIVSNDYNTTTLNNTTDRRPKSLTWSKKHHHQGKTFMFVSLHSNVNFVYFGGLITRMVLRAKRGSPIHVQEQNDCLNPWLAMISSSTFTHALISAAKRRCNTILKWSYSPPIILCSVVFLQVSWIYNMNFY